MERMRLDHHLPTQPRSPGSGKVSMAQQWIAQVESRKSGNDVEPYDDEILDRIWEKAFSPLLSTPDNTIMEFGRLLDKTKSFGSTRELIDELTFLDEWKVSFVDGDSIKIAQSVHMLQTLLVQTFLKKIIDLEGWYSAHWFEDQYGIKPSRLRKAVQRGKISKMGTGKASVYSLASVRRLWKEDFIDIDA